MKPPPRKRTRTSRELAPVPQPRGRAVCKWPQAEQRKLLAALTKLSPGELSAGETPDPERVREHLPTRTAEEINSVLEGLKEKVILFAITKQRAERREERRAQKPLEMWIQEAFAVSGGVEEPLSSAFTQMLTVTSVEPCTLRSSAHPQPHSPARPLSKASSAPPLLGRSPSVSTTPPAQSPPVTEDSKKTPQHHQTPTPAQRPLVPVTPPQSSVRSPPLSPSPMTKVSFEKIYQYLSALHKPSEQCRLTPMESAIVLDLLMSLPEELLLLDCDKLSEHLSQVYLNLSSDADSRRRTKDSSNGVKRQHPSVVPDHQQLQSSPEDSSTQRSTHPLLNPFLIPVSLMSRKAPTNPT